MSSIYAAVRDLADGPSGQAVFNALVDGLPKTLPVLEKRLNLALTGNLPRRMRRSAREVAIDFHLVPYYGTPYKSRNELYYGKPQRGTKHFHAYASACIVEYGLRYTVAFTWVRRHESTVKVLERLLAQIDKIGLKTRCLLLDRAFFNVPVTELLQQKRLPFLPTSTPRARPKRPTRPAALRYDTRGGLAGIDVRFEVVRIWERPAAALLTGGLGMAPLVPLGELRPDSPEAALPRVLRGIDERLAAELPPADAKRLLMAAWILVGMRVGRSTLKLLEETMAMVDLRDSSTYHLILEEGLVQGMQEGLAKGMQDGLAKGKAEGKAEGLRTMLLQVGARRFGPPTAAMQESLNAVDDVARLHRLGERVLDVADWQELLDTP